MTNARLEPLLPPRVADAIEQIRAATVRGQDACRILYDFWVSAGQEGPSPTVASIDYQEIGEILDAFIQTYPLKGFETFQRGKLPVEPE